MFFESEEADSDGVEVTLKIGNENSHHGKGSYVWLSDYPDEEAYPLFDIAEYDELAAKPYYPAAPAVGGEAKAAARYKRLRILGQLTNGNVIRFQSLDDFLDADIENNPSRDEYPAPSTSNADRNPSYEPEWQLMDGDKAIDAAHKRRKSP